MKQAFGLEDLAGQPIHRGAHEKAAGTFPVIEHAGMLDPPHDAQRTGLGLEDEEAVLGFDDEIEFMDALRSCETNGLTVCLMEPAPSQNMRT